MTLSLGRGYTPFFLPKIPEKPGTELHTGQAAHCNSAVMQEWYHTELFLDHEDRAGVH